MDALSTATGGLLSATRSFDAAATRTVQGTGDPVTDTVDQIQSKEAFQASLAVIKTSDQMFKSLLDIKV
jgi:hypothetical protein